MRKGKRKKVLVRGSIKMRHILWGLLVFVVVGICSCTNAQEYKRDFGQTGGVDCIRGYSTLQAGMRQVCELMQRWDSYPDELKEMVRKYPETLPFVLGYEKGKTTSPRSCNIDISDECRKGRKGHDGGNIPLFIQWDSRWGYCSYGDSMIGLSGCGPTCLSMVVVGLTGDTRRHPAGVAAFSEESGFMIPEVGTDWRLFSTGAEQLGLTVHRLFLTEEDVRRELEEGHPIICSVRPGDFTYTGHFIVLTDIDERGNLCVNDPNSRKNSERTWNLKRVLSQVKSAWSYSRAKGRVPWKKTEVIREMT